MDKVKNISCTALLHKLMLNKQRSIISERFAYCFALNPADLLYDNDNNNEKAQTANALDSAIVKAALRLFAQHGLASADRAAAHAERCFWANDPLGHKWWMAVLRQLDNNLVASTKASTKECGAGKIFWPSDKSRNG